MKEKWKGFIFGVAVCSLLTGTVAYASTGTQIEVYFKNLKYMFDGIEKKPTEGQGFIYDGTTYVPLRFVSEAIGKDVSWDGENETIWVGRKDGDSKYLASIEYARADNRAKNYLSFDKWNSYAANTNTGDQFKIASTRYSHGLGIGLGDFSNDKAGSIEYNLNGKYKTLTGIVGVDDSTKNSLSLGTLRIVGDDKELYAATDLKGGDLPKNIQVNLTGVLRLRIEFESDVRSYNNLNIVLAEAKLIQ